MENKTKKVRIWELDAFRGLCILGMIFVHAVWDLDNVFLSDYTPPLIYEYMIDYGALLFITLSGVCVTLGKHSIKRGLTVLGAAMLVSFAFFMLEPLGIGSFAPVWFGILHLLGVCMLLYPLFKRLPHWCLIPIAMLFILLGRHIENIAVDFKPLLVLGFKSGIFMSDYFPLFPNLGWFLLGAALGRLLYQQKTSLFPKFPYNNFICRFLMLCGRQSLIIYILHQPIVYGILWLIFG